MSLGSNIKSLREDRGFSLEYVATKLNMLKKLYLDIERGINIPSSAILVKLAQLYNISQDDIINYVPTTQVINRTTPQNNFIGTNPSLISRDDLSSIGNNINIVSARDIESTVTTSFDGLIVDDNKSISSKVLNWVEPYIHRDKEKTLFYTEVNSNLKVGDRVFMIGGNYDSDTRIKINKYRKGRDGYRVLYVDNCRVALDIDYTGVFPHNEDDEDNFINIYYIKDIDDFRYFNRQISTKSDNVDYKFNKRQNNFVFSDIARNGFSGWGENNGIPNRGFFVKDDAEWIDITEYIITANLSNYLSNIFNSNMKIRIVNGSFTFDIDDRTINFREGQIYRWGSDVGDTHIGWVLDNTYSVPILTKSNFRNGRFEGNFNSGLYGQYDKRIDWNGIGTWNMGTMLNINWTLGKINSLYTISNSFYGYFDNQIPYQKISAPNNNGYGFNLAYDCDIQNADITNGTIYNSNILGSNISTVENFIKETITPTYNISGGLLINSKIENSSLWNTKFTNSELRNSYIDRCVSNNSTIKQSVFIESQYISEADIKILGYDEFIFSYIPTEKITHKIYRFYINKNDARKININKHFYFSKLKISDGSNYPLNFFDRKFRISSWTEYVDFWSGAHRDIGIGETFYKRGIEMAAFLNTPSDNKWIHSVYGFSPTNYTNALIEINNISEYSIDIFVSYLDINENAVNNTQHIPKSEIPNSINPELGGLILNNDTNISSSPQIPKKTNKIRNIIDISEASICFSDFDSGIIYKSDWVSGNHINYNNDVNILHPNLYTLEGGVFDIILNQFDSELIINTTYNNNYAEAPSDSLLVDDIVFLKLDFIIDNEIIPIPLSYKVVSNELSTNGRLILKEIFTTDSFLSTLSSAGYFTIHNSNSRYAYIHRTHITKSKVLGGIFRRPLITDSLIENITYNTKNRTLNNIDSIRSLVISDAIFKNNNNIISKALYLSCSFIYDTISNAFLYRSIFSDGIFLDGMISQSSWISGQFEGGLFFDNRSFWATPNAVYQFFNDDRVKSYYKSGVADTNTANNRYAWQGGTFSGGEFIRSDWESGVFSDGKLYNSKVYGGTISGGIIGDFNTPLENTHIYSAYIINTTVNNATLFAKDTSYDGLVPSSIIWLNGTFNNGIFGSIDKPPHSTSIWYNGTFNNGDFISYAKWINGIFNSGYFKSTLNWEFSSSTSPSDYTWENGIFNGGEFGNMSLLDNSTWYDGEFNGGRFIGRVWNNGLFTFGSFEGSGMTASGGLPNSNASIFVSSYTQSYYGLWRDGIFTNNRNLYSNNPLVVNQNRFIEATLPTAARITNSLWENGTFSHNTGIFYNSVWLNGLFDKGTMIMSSFNPYVTRQGKESLELNDSCYWKRGTFIDGDFYISKWENGIFKSGNAWGMIWKDGVSEYMNAFNIFWENGIWKNGNWYGSYIPYEGSISDNFHRQILMRGISWSGTYSIHLWNIFNESEDFSYNIDTITASSIIYL
jgi:transcriptional regulator with XRE-family HTH domain